MRLSVNFGVFGSALLATVAVLQPASAKLGSCDHPITLGTTMSSTGRYSTLAERWRVMTIIFAEEFNKGGGVYVKACKKKLPIKFVIYDDQSVPSLAVTLYEKLITVDKVDFLVGPDWSAMGFPVPPVAEKHKVPMVMANVAAPPIFKRGLKYMWGTPMPTVPNWSTRYFDLLAQQKPAPKTIFFVTHDNPVTKAITRFWTKAAKKRGFKIVGREIFGQDLKDFTSLILKMRIAKPDIIYISSFDVPAVPLIQQMRRLRVKAKDVHTAILTGKLQDQLGKDVEGLTGELAWYPGVKGPYSDFAERVLKRAKIDMFYYWTTMSRFSAYLIMIQAIEKAGVVDREAVKKALYKGKFKTPIGIVEFNAEGYAFKNGAMTTQIQNGKVVIVAPADRATGKFQYPSPSWSK
jgi:branched-chain amino acid transport system substrate-binding protein